MNFDAGGAFGGALGGAATGMGAFGPIGAAIGGIGGLLTGGLAGGSAPTYQPSALQEALMGYAENQVTASPSRKKAIKNQFKSLVAEGNRGAGEAFLESYLDRFSNPDFIEKRLAKSYKRPVDYGGGGYWDVANQLYSQQGLGFSADEFGQFVNQAKARGIRSPQAFGDMLKSGLVAAGKVMTPQQEMLSYIFGDPARDASGKITNKYYAGEGLTPEEMTEIYKARPVNKFTTTVSQVS